MNCDENNREKCFSDAHAFIAYLISQKQTQKLYMTSLLSVKGVQRLSGKKLKLVIYTIKKVRTDKNRNINQMRAHFCYQDNTKP